MEVDGEEDRKGQEVAEEERPSFLPPSIDNDWECKRCYQVDSCMLYRKAVEQVEDTNSPIADLYEKKTGHLSVVHADFFRKWEELISFEEQDATRFASELWTMSSVEREKTGRLVCVLDAFDYSLCFGNMIVESYEVGSGASASKVHRHTYRFRRATLPPSPSQKPSSSSSSSKPDTHSLLSGHLSAGEPISIFRIDKDELASGMGRIRDNLAQMFFVDGDEKRRSMVVDLDPPQFDESLKPTEEEMSGRGLNGDQKLAMEKVMTAKDYALILGMPGTGKTTTIVEIIVALAKRGKSVLLTSYTHSAVDTILVKLLNLNLRLLRLGNPDKIHPDCQHLTLGALGPAANMEQYEHRLMSPQVVATTALTIDQ
ncbi:AAA domain-containing protein [Mrakia frigida]|uniref:bifunctional ATP-dependent DNA helicase/ssDNA endodeoxyribonuclease DNA2 n=1 Tax=Mrakia frigida TaxID=29902 RepID=UPI003FCBF95E